MKCAVPFVSIVTVSLNAVATIGDTIASVSFQESAFEVEHICVDGGSTDGSREIIAGWAARSDHLIAIFEPDTGIFDAMNKGLRAASGEYVLFLNADDFLVAKRTLAEVMDGLELGAPQNPDLIVGNVAMANLGRRGLWRHRRVPPLLGRIRGCGLFPVHPAQFTKRQLLNDVGGFNTALGLSSDVIQYYDLERIFKPTMRLIYADITFMRLGGASNAGAKVMYLATVEFYKHLLSTYSHARAAFIVIVKTLQSLLEIRYGQCPHSRWFAQ